MLRALLTHRWSTLNLLSLSVGMSALAYLGGRLQTSKSGMPSRLPLSDVPLLSMATASAVAGANESEKIPLDLVGTGFDERWERCSAGPRTPEIEEEMVGILEELAVWDPTSAMAWALGEDNVLLRQRLRGAVLHGWASACPTEAAAWALELPAGDRQLALEAVFSGAVGSPDEAMQLAALLSAQNPEQAEEYGQFLINALTESGAYEMAARFATANSSASQGAWVHEAFLQWATHQPEQACRALSEISDLGVRDAAFKGMILGWAMAEPSTLVSYAMRLPPGENRANALSQALPQWVGRDTLVASEWINQLDPSPDLDTGAAAVATLPNLVNKRPEIAVSWAQSIDDPVLRANALRTVAEQWAQRDQNGLRRFLADASELRSADRTALTDGLQPPPDG